MAEKKTMAAKTPGLRVPSYAEGELPVAARRRREHLVSAHVDSFNYLLSSGLDQAVQNILPMDVKVDEDLYIRLQYSSVQVGYPSRREDAVAGKLTPREAREREMTYAAPMVAAVTVSINDDAHVINISSRCGDLPVMVMSERCHLRGLSSRALVNLKEEPNESGGYFVMNGIERVVRLLQVPRRNHAMAIERSSYKNRGLAYSDKGVAMRCVRPDQSSVTVTLHYLNNGGATLRFVLRKQEFLLPVVMVAKALVDLTDKEFFDRVVSGDTNNTFMTTRLELLLRDAKSYNVFTCAHARAFLGSLFRGYLPITDRVSDEEAGKILLERFIFVHTDSFHAKLECLVFMLRKLFSFAQGHCLGDNADALMNHELLLPGHLLTMYIKEKLEETLLAIRQVISRDYRLNKTKCLSDIKSAKYFQTNFDRFGGNIGGKIGTFLSTGNVVSSTGMDLMQVSGYTIVAERLNIYRYMSHFQSVHRGQFFTTMKTTTVRKLLPESWGFLCPVHTPDGSPCGLLNHLAKEAVIMAFPANERMPTTTQGPLVAPVGSVDGKSDWVDPGIELRRLLVAVGVEPGGAGSGDGQLVISHSNHSSDGNSNSGSNSNSNSNNSNSSDDGSHIPVLVDGVVVGGLLDRLAPSVVAQLRSLKTTGGTGDRRSRLDPTTELAYIPRMPGGHPGAYPGLYIFTQPGRMIRPVMNLQTRQVEWLGPMEQVFMNIACLPEDVDGHSTTHIELNPSVMLSQVAALTPFSDYNQSPRNMYQCQMGKQTMGTPALALKQRSDNKMFRIQHPQAPIVQTQAHRDYCMDEYPQGANAVVAVISYTGYDMEDAMIINKSSFERGFGHGCVYKTVVIDLDEEERRLTSNNGRPSFKFCNIKSGRPAHGKELPSTATGEEDAVTSVSGMIGEKYCEMLDLDGLPHEGEIIEDGSPLCCLVDTISGEFKIIKHKDHERAYVQTVRVLGAATGKIATSSASSSSAGAKKGGSIRKVSVTLRYRRNPIIGDKFSSRHGQKGTLSVLWPQENMPFSESGMSPDVLINPHAFPSRMTIGMLIESMAGKAGAMHGIFQDATPFQFHEENRVIDYLGEQLRSCGYHYHGSEPLYNGLTGKPMKADIFIGVVYYQRLRHMVSDKSQVRSTGPVMPITRQPVKGRKKHGGIRLGEMERDALISHGVAFCLHDRLMNSSDTHLAYACSTCGGLLDVYAQNTSRVQLGDIRSNNQPFKGGRSVQFCSTCKSAAGVRPIYLPYVYRYLANELAGMGIKMTMTLSE